VFVDVFLFVFSSIIGAYSLAGRQRVYLSRKATFLSFDTSSPRRRIGRSFPPGINPFRPRFRHSGCRRFCCYIHRGFLALLPFPRGALPVFGSTFHSPPQVTGFVLGADMARSCGDLIFISDRQRPFAFRFLSEKDAASSEEWCRVISADPPASSMT